MIPDQLMDAIHFAEFVMAKEKKDRIGSSAAVVYPMKFFFFHDRKETTGLMGAPSHHPSLDEKDILALVMRMFAQALEARRRAPRDRSLDRHPMRLLRQPHPGHPQRTLW